MASNPSPQGSRGFWRWLMDQFHMFFDHPLDFLWAKIRALGMFLWKILKWLAGLIYRMVTAVSRRVWITVGITLAVIFVLLVGGFIAAVSYVDRQIAPAAKIDEVRYLGQGWGTEPNSPQRQTYYHTPQGAYVQDLRYDWMVHLERPWSEARFADEKFMRAYGFIVDQADLPNNPGHLPVGFATRYDASYGEMMLDLTCAACHTGELQYVKDGVRYGVRVDGGSGGADLKGMHPGHFAMDLAVSLAATYVNPFKFSRFAENVLGKHNNSRARATLRHNLGKVLKKAFAQAMVERRLHVYPVEEGYGRTDGLGRILNTAFAVNLSEKNYRVANAPVSYPPVWDIYKFDWVQYTGSVRQPMARNLGEAMGVGARYYLVDPYGRPLPDSERYEASTMLPNLDSIERSLRKLTPPCWPEDIFGPINKPLAEEGSKLFATHCVKCHGPYLAKDYQTEADAPLKLYQFESDAPPDWVQRAAAATGQGKTMQISIGRSDPLKQPSVTERIVPGTTKDAPPPKLETPIPHWIITMINIQDVGTDATSALNFVRYRLDLTETGLTAEQVRNALTRYAVRDYHRQVAYNDALSKDSTVAEVQRQAAKTLHDHLVSEGEDGYLREQLGGVQLSSVSLGVALNYLITLVRDQAYQDMGMHDDRAHDNVRHVWDGFGQLDLPQVFPQYKARPLAGIWATPPFLHNGSVPSLYQMLVPAYERSKKFYRKTTLFDPYAVGLYSDASEKGAFLFDTSITGSSNSGHEFRAGYRPWKEGDPPSYGVIGPELTEHERWALVEYLKVHRDDPNDKSCSVYVAPPAPRYKP
ncbi:MAG: hypothetical protein LAO20_16090 [Acidobacteriia bacterium]|nr:hypothetical protein [Terriglobia bacterium]